MQEIAQADVTWLQFHRPLTLFLSAAEHELGDPSGRGGHRSGRGLAQLRSQSLYHGVGLEPGAAHVPRAAAGQVHADGELPRHGDADRHHARRVSQ